MGGSLECPECGKVNLPHFIAKNGNRCCCCNHKFRVKTDSKGRIKNRNRIQKEKAKRR